MSTTAILIPGLGDDPRFYQWVTKDWKSKFGVEVLVMPFGWKQQSTTLLKRIAEYVELIDKLTEQGEKVVLIGTSAGGSACVNIYAQAAEQIATVVNVCGRLRTGNNVFPSLALAARNHPLFKVSVELCERNLLQLDDLDRQKFLTLRPLLDEIVPTSTVTIPGAKNIRICSVEHMLSMALCFTIYRGEILTMIA